MDKLSILYDQGRMFRTVCYLETVCITIQVKSHIGRLVWVVLGFRQDDIAVMHLAIAEPSIKYFLNLALHNLLFSHLEDDAIVNVIKMSHKLLDCK